LPSHFLNPALFVVMIAATEQLLDSRKGTGAKESVPNPMGLSAFVFRKVCAIVIIGRARALCPAWWPAWWSTRRHVARFRPSPILHPAEAILCYAVAPGMCRPISSRFHIAFPVAPPVKEFLEQGHNTNDRAYFQKLMPPTTMARLILRVLFIRIRRLGVIVHFTFVLASAASPKDLSQPESSGPGCSLSTIVVVMALFG
jgi:hypothetical protein